MTALPFIKMHGAGNDYVFIDCFEDDLPDSPEALVTQISDRHRGIGGDGLILIVPPEDDSADVEMRMWNADGSAGQMCGNGARCVALWMFLQKRVQQTCRIATASRVVCAKAVHVDASSLCGKLTVEMGSPGFDPTGTTSVLSDPVVSVTSSAGEPQPLEYTFVSVGNPHAVVFGHELSDDNVHRVGAAIQRHDRFPEGVNVEWVDVRSETELVVRVLERGSGETQACGSGACAAVAAAVERGICVRDTDVSVRLPGGEFVVRWRSSGALLLTGPAAVSFWGEWPLGAENCTVSPV